MSEHQSFPSWAKSILLALAISTVITLSLSNFLIADNKFGEAMRKLCADVSACPDPYTWVRDDDAELSKQLTTGTNFVFPTLNGAQPNGPVPGNQKYGEKQAIKLLCDPIEQDAFILHDGETILETDRLLISGWKSDSWVGEPEAPDWNKFNAEVQRRFGFNPAFSEHSRCSHGNFCTLSPSEIKNNSRRIRVKIGECERFGLGSINLSQNHSSLDVQVIGHAVNASIVSIHSPFYTYKVDPTKQWWQVAQVLFPFGIFCAAVIALLMTSLGVFRRPA